MSSLSSVSHGAPPPTAEMQAAEEALRALRLSPLPREYDLYGHVGNALRSAGLSFRREAAIASRCRVDFLLPGGTAIEVKRGAPQTRAWRAQLARYAASPDVTGLLLLAERAVELPTQLAGKPCRALSLGRFWGIAL